MDHPEQPNCQPATGIVAHRLGIPAFLAFRTLGLGREHRPTLKEHRRAIRVWLLVVTIIVLSVADLYMTLAHLRSAGMGEANPLARMVISYQSPLLLSLWKLACVGLASLIFVLARYRRSAEAACWVCCLVMTALTVHWIQYSNEAAACTMEISNLTGADRPADWVSIETEGAGQTGGGGGASGAGETR